MSILNNPLNWKIEYYIKLVGSMKYIPCANTRFVDLDPGLVELYKIMVYDSNGIIQFTTEFETGKSIIL